MKKYAIIVAGGSGKRMNSTTPKQFLELAGIPVLMHTINAFAQYDELSQIIVVLPSSQISTWKDLCTKHNFSTSQLIIEGGEERFYSVKNALNELPNEGIVAIHDGVRPLINQELIRSAFQVAEKYDSAIPAVTPKESLRKISNESSIAVIRDEYRIIQTPQCFKLSILQEAYHADYDSSFTDDASVVEKLGYQITLIEGCYENIKITTPHDLAIAEVLLKNI